MRYRWVPVRRKNEPCETAIDARVAPSISLVASCDELRPGRDHGGQSFFALKVDASVGEDRRSRVVALEPLAPAQRAGLRVETGRDADVADDVEQVADEQRRRRVRRRPRQRPGDVAARHVAGAVDPHREQRRLLETGRDVDQSVTEHRTRHVRETVVVADPPDLAARFRIVGGGPIGADADQLIAIADPNHQRRRVGLVRRLAARRLPAHLVRSACRARRRTRRRCRRS